MVGHWCVLVIQGFRQQVDGYGTRSIIVQLLSQHHLLAQGQQIPPDSPYPSKNP